MCACLPHGTVTHQLGAISELPERAMSYGPAELPTRVHAGHNSSSSQYQIFAQHRSYPSSYALSTTTILYAYNSEMRRSQSITMYSPITKHPECSNWKKPSVISQWPTTGSNSTSISTLFEFKKISFPNPPMLLLLPGSDIPPPLSKE